MQNIMTKSDAIEAILRFNPSASAEFLDGFSTEELAEYLDRLTGAEPRRPTGADPTVRPDASPGPYPARPLDDADPLSAFAASAD